MDFKAWPNSKVASYKPVPAAADRTAVPFTAASNYSSDFKGVSGEVRKPFKPVATMAESSGEFHANTTSRDDFLVHKDAERARPVLPKGTVIQNLPFSGASTHALDFPVHSSAVRRSFKPNEVGASVVAEDRDFKTESRGNFPVYAGVHSSQICKPRSGQSHVVPENRDFQSESHATYVALDGRPSQACRPARSIALESQPFDATTTSRTDFPRFEGVKPLASYKPKPNTQSVVPESRDFVTETRGNFIQMKPDPSKSFKGSRPSEFQIVPEDRTFVTESRDMVLPAGTSGRREAFKPKGTVFENLPFSGASTHALDFPVHSSAVRRSFKPNEVGASVVAEDRDFLTDHRSNFQRHGQADYKAGTMHKHQQKQDSIRYVH